MVTQQHKDVTAGKGAQMLLETQALPLLLRKVGDKQSGRVSYARVDQYLAAHALKFDRNRLMCMFREADYRQEGSLTARDLTATLSDRYPKRQHTADWRELVALILGVQHLTLLDVDKEPILQETLAMHRKHAIFSYAAWPDVEDMKPVRPKRKSGSNCSSGHSTNREWQAIAARRAAAQCAGVADSWESSAVTTSRGLKHIHPTGAEQAINGTLAAAATTISHFDGVQRFDEHSQGLHLRSSLNVGSNPGAFFDAAFATMERRLGGGDGCASGASTARQRYQPATVQGQQQQRPSSASSSMGKRLSPRVPMFPPSALQKLRDSVTSSAMLQPEFQVHFKRLGTGDLEQKTCMGMQLDLSGRGPTSWV